MLERRKPGDRGASALAAELLATLERERLIPRFVDSYVVEHGRYGLQVHPTQYRELLELLKREALLAMTACALAQAPSLLRAGSKKQRARETRRLAAVFRRTYLTSLTRLNRWTAGDALEFQGDLAIYERLLAPTPKGGKRKKLFQAAEGPFVDRCAFLLDPSLLEKARPAAGRVLVDLERAATDITSRVLTRAAAPNPNRRSR